MMWVPLGGHVEAQEGRLPIQIPRHPLPLFRDTVFPTGTLYRVEKKNEDRNEDGDTQVTQPPSNPQKKTEKKLGGLHGIF